MSPAAAILPPLSIVPMEARHAGLIVRQPSQTLTLGLAAGIDERYAAELIAAPGQCWAAIAGDLERANPEQGSRVLALFGLIEIFRFKQATGWAVLAQGLGAHHLGITRFAAARIAESVYHRIEIIAECADAEPLLERMGPLDPGQLVAALTVPALRTAGVRWALALGMTPAAVLRKYGAASETHMLFEQVR